MALRVEGEEGGLERSIVRRSQNLVGKSCVFVCGLVEEVVEELALRLPAPLSGGSRIIVVVCGKRGIGLERGLRKRRSGGGGAV
jgi:hypothetical protein